MLRIGLLVNPVAGVGGPAGMKGSDGDEAQQRATELGVKPQAIARAGETFFELARILSDANSAERGQCRVVTLKDAMGEESLESLDTSNVLIEREVLEQPQVALPTTADTTRAGVEALIGQVDVLVFAGGDGTARDVLDALTELNQRSQIPVLGIPAGVKMHSGVFATSPGSAARLLAELTQGGLVAAHLAEVRDIDEAALRRGVVGSQRYGELLVPSAGDYLQHVKSGGKEVEALVLLEIAAEVAESFGGESTAPNLPVKDMGAEESVMVVGPGSTCFAVKEQLLSGSSGSCEPTLLGVDVIQAGELLVQDATSADLLSLQQEWPALIALVSFSRGQGFVLGRGNQQLAPEFLERLPFDALHIVSSRTKLKSLNGRPLLVDCGSADLDRKFSGLQSIISGYQDRLLYLVKPG